VASKEDDIISTYLNLIYEEKAESKEDDDESDETSDDNISAAGSH
ncbi:15606_t:CDS:1, partial [Cetraspora pellucida]